MDTAASDGHPPSWYTYAIFTIIAFCASMVGGCINRSEQRQKHEQLMGKMEELNGRLLSQERNRR